MGGKRVVALAPCLALGAAGSGSSSSHCRLTDSVALAGLDSVDSGPPQPGVTPAARRRAKERVEYWVLLAISLYGAGSGGDARAAQDHKRIVSGFRAIFVVGGVESLKNEAAVCRYPLLRLTHPVVCDPAAATMDVPDNLGRCRGRTQGPSTWSLPCRLTCETTAPRPSARP